MDHKKTFVSRVFDRLLAGDVAMQPNPLTADLVIKTKQNPQQQQQQEQQQQQTCVIR